MTGDAERPPGEAGAVRGSAGQRIKDHSTTVERLFGCIGWAQRWRRFNQAGPYEPLVVADLAWQRALAEASV